VSETVTKTLQATLVQPTTGKEERLQRLPDTYRDALHAVATIMSAVNDVVTPYDLPYQAKTRSNPTSRNSGGRATPRS
jgi:hypothetical protein